MNIEEIQDLLKQNNLDGWLLYDFRKSNPLAWSICGVKNGTHCTRRWAVWIPSSGEPVKIVHAIEQHTLQHLNFRTITYSNKDSWRDALENVLQQVNTVAMEYSPNNDIPVVSFVDAGTKELVESFDVKVVSSADCSQAIDSVWTKDQLIENLETAKLLRAAMMDSFQFVREKLQRNQMVTEFDVQQNITRYFGENGLYSDDEPIVAIGPNAANPHYAPTPTLNSEIKIGDVLLIDMWAKTTKSNSTYADITWMAYCGETVPQKVADVFSLIKNGRDAALKLVQERFANSIDVMGYEIDDACRNVIENAGFGDKFIHRTGHNITTVTHGSGANIDNFETHDTRKILRGTSFSIEPGIYIDGEMGQRTEIDVVIDFDGKVLVPSEPIQQDVLPLLSSTIQLK